MQCSDNRVDCLLALTQEQQHPLGLVCCGLRAYSALLTAASFACCVLAVLQNCTYAVTRDVLPDGTVIPAGSQVIYSPYVVNRMETFWGPDALAFRPERWLEMDTTPSPYNYLTFNAGMGCCKLAGCCWGPAVVGNTAVNWGSLLQLATALLSVH